jgi:NAD+ synthase
MTAALVPRLPAHALETIERFLGSEVGGGPGVVVGLSGGIDSALCARLARDALGPEKVLGVLLPDDGPSQTLVAETVGYAHDLGIASTVIPIGPVVRSFRQIFPVVHDPVTAGNIAARTRMTILYTLARERSRRVMGTGNKSELLLGYFTKYGDGGIDLLPIGDLYKTEVWALAERLGLPEAVRTRVPTAGLWEGQTDEGEIGLPYREVDRILRGIEELRSPAEIAELTGQPLERVEGIVRRVGANRHKRRLPPIPKIGLRTIGIDWRD